MLLAALVVPNVIQAVDTYLSNLPPDYSRHALGATTAISVKLGQGLFVVWFAWRTGRGLEAFGVVKPKLIDIVCGALAFGILLLAMKVCDPFQAFLNHFAGARRTGMPMRGMGLAGISIYYVLTVFFEEILYRSYLCTRLRDLGWTPIWIALSTSILFSLTHFFQGWAVLPTTMLFGLILALIFIRLRTIWPSKFGM